MIDFQNKLDNPAWMPTEIELKPFAQVWADEVIDALGQAERIVRHPALTALTNWLDRNDAMTAVVCNNSNWIHAPYLENVVEQAWNEQEGLPESESPLAAVARVMRAALAGDNRYWGDEYWVPICGTLRRSDGRRCILAFQLEDYLSGPYDWDGVFRDIPTFLEHVRSGGRITSFRQFEEMGAEPALELWQRWAR